MKCGLRERAILYFYGEISREEKPEIAKHISSCDICQRTIEELKRVNIFLSFEPKISANIEDYILNYSSIKKYGKNFISQTEKIFSFAFSFAVILLFLIPFANKSDIVSTTIENDLNSLEAEFLTFKDEMTEWTNYDFDYKLSEFDYMDLKEEIL